MANENLPVRSEDSNSWFLKVKEQPSSNLTKKGTKEKRIWHILGLVFKADEHIQFELWLSKLSPVKLFSKPGIEFSFLKKDTQFQNVSKLPKHNSPQAAKWGRKRVLRAQRVTLKRNECTTCSECSWRGNAVCISVVNKRKTQKSLDSGIKQELEEYECLIGCGKIAKQNDWNRKLGWLQWQLSF